MLSCSLDNLSLSSTGHELSSSPQLTRWVLCLQGCHLLPAEWHKFGVFSTVLIDVFKLITKGDLLGKLQNRCGLGGLCWSELQLSLGLSEKIKFAKLNMKAGKNHEKTEVQSKRQTEYYSKSIRLKQNLCSGLIGG